MKFKARVIAEMMDINADTAQHAARCIREAGYEVICVVPENEPWPNPAQEEQPFKRPPRNTPPSGSPGTPTPGKAPEFVQAVAA
jgi:hypothetical protein